MTVQDILDISNDDFLLMDRSQLAKATKILADAGNKRLKRFSSKGITTPATRYVEQSGGKFSVAGKDLNELRHEFMRVKGFMEAKTGSAKGYKSVVDKTLDKINDKTGSNITPENFDKFWRAFEKLKESDPNVSSNAMKYKVMKEVASEIDDSNLNIDDVVNDILGRMSEIYETAEEDFLNDTSEFFEL